MKNTMIEDEIMVWYPYRKKNPKFKPAYSGKFFCVDRNMGSHHIYEYDIEDEMFYIGHGNQRVEVDVAYWTYDDVLDTVFWEDEDA